MTFEEGIVALNFHAKCTYQNIYHGFCGEYYICGVEICNNPKTGKKTKSVILQDPRADSTIHASLSEVTVTDWNAPQGVVDALLTRAKNGATVQTYNAVFPM